MLSDANKPQASQTETCRPFQVAFAVMVFETFKPKSAGEHALVVLCTTLVFTLFNVIALPGGVWGGGGDPTVGNTRRRADSSVKDLD